MGGALFACLVLCLTLAPLADSVICSAEASAVESLFERTHDEVTAASHDHGGKGHSDSGDACVHGHCHQTPAAAEFADVQLADASSRAIDLTPAETGLPPSRTPDGPMEPPRA